MSDGGVTRGSGRIAIAMMVMNVSSYGFTILTARVVGPGEYGAFVAALNLVLVIQVVALGLQATAARRIAAEPTHVASVERAILSVTLKISLALGALLVLLSPAINRLLNLDNLFTAVLIAICAVPLTLAGGQMGVLQGERRWHALSLMYVMGGVPRLLIGLAIISQVPSTEAALTGVTIGFGFPVLAGWWALRNRRTPDVTLPQHGLGQLLRESFHNSQALFAYLTLSSVDIVIARNVLSEHNAGLYAGGLIVTKAMLFLPQFVVVVAFPAMAARAHDLRTVFRAMCFVAALGTVVTIGTWALSDLAMIFIGGSEFVEVQSTLWLFAILGSLLSMVQLLVYATLARQGRRSAILVWAAMAILVVGGLATTTFTSLVLVAIAVDTGLLLALLAIAIHLSSAASNDIAPASDATVT